MRSKKRTIVLVLCSAFLLVVAFYPFTTEVVPAWRIQVIDQQGIPYGEMQVRQAWKHYSLELEPGENIEDRLTDNEGYVEFPERTIRLSLLSRLLRVAFTRAAKLFHGSTGIHADVAATGPKGYESVEYVPGAPPARLILPR